MCSSLWRTALLTLLACLCGAAASAQTPARSSLTGTVADATGGVLPGASVTLRDQSGTSLAQTTTDANGAFHFDQLAPGRYDITVSLSGFQPTTTAATIAARPGTSTRLQIVLPLAGRTEDVTVGSAPLDASRNSDAVAVDQEMLDALPLLDRDPVAALSRFLDAGAIGTGGVTLVVNGMEVNSLGVSASAIAQIKINQDPYSAEYARPGRGRIEVLTKPGSQVYHGELNTVFRDARLDARNAFAVSPPSERRRIAEGMVSGPLGSTRTTSFVLSGSADIDDQENVIAAAGPDGPIRGTAPQPNRHDLISGSVTTQKSKSTLISVRSSYEYQSSLNRGVGGTTLETAGTDYTHHEAAIIYNQQTVLRPSLVLQFQVLGGHEIEPTTSASNLQGTVVAGAFTGGGAQVSLLRTETHVQASETLTWMHGAHTVQSGVQVPDWSLRGFDDRSQFGGTFYFSNLNAYGTGRPYAFIQQRGNGRIDFLEKVLGVYVKDDWQAASGVTLSFGARYDWANYFRDNNNVSPRASVAFSPGGQKGLVIRAGAGLFYDRLGAVSYVETQHYGPNGLQRIVLTDPPYPDPFAGSAPSAAPPSVVQLAPDVQEPWTLQYSLGVERQLKTVSLAVTFSGSEGRHLFRSRDVNAPLPPDYGARPNAAYGVVREIESSGRLQGRSLQFTLRSRSLGWFSGQMQYTLSRTDTDTSGVGSFPSNDYDLSGEWARADFDRRHQFMLLGRVSPRHVVDLGVSATLQSGAPYTATLGADPFNNGRGNARPPGLARNTLQGDSYADFDLRIARDLTFEKGTPHARSVTISLDAFNLLNRVNYGSYVGTLSSPLFGQPVSARAPRQLQISARYAF